MVTSGICMPATPITEVIARSSSNFGIGYEESIRYSHADVRTLSLKRESSHPHEAIFFTLVKKIGVISPRRSAQTVFLTAP